MSAHPQASAGPRRTTSTTHRKARSVEPLAPKHEPEDLRNQVLGYLQRCDRRRNQASGMNKSLEIERYRSNSYLARYGHARRGIRTRCGPSRGTRFSGVGIPAAWISRTGPVANNNLVRLLIFVPFPSLNRYFPCVTDTDIGVYPGS
jgi:hypothetical protein